MEPTDPRCWSQRANRVSSQRYYCIILCRLEFTLYEGITLTRQAKYSTVPTYVVTNNHTHLVRMAVLSSEQLARGYGYATITVRRATSAA